MSDSNAPFFSDFASCAVPILSKPLGEGSLQRVPLRGREVASIPLVRLLNLWQKDSITQTTCQTNPLKGLGVKETVRLLCTSTTTTTTECCIHWPGRQSRLFHSDTGTRTCEGRWQQSHSFLKKKMRHVRLLTNACWQALVLRPSHKAKLAMDRRPSLFRV